MEDYKLLTRDFGRGSKCGSQLWVHVDHHVLLRLHLCVSFLNIDLDPICKDVLQDRVAHIGEPLLGHLVDLLLVGHVLPHVLVPFAEKVGDIFEREAIVLWDLDMSDVPTLDICMS